VKAAVEIVRPGMLTTVQDRGRPGLGRFGVSPSGAMDPLALRVANLLVGNDPEAPALEITGPGTELLFLSDTQFALAGADLGAELDGAPLPAVSATAACAGQQLAFTARVCGARATFALAGGLELRAVLGSASTDVAAGLGGLDGRPLRRGQRLAPSIPLAGSRPAAAARSPSLLAATLLSAYGDKAVLRFVPADEAGIPPGSRAAFVTTGYRLSPHSNRTGYRFAGTPLPTLAEPDRLSEPTAPGALQLPPDGLPILLMADRNTTGGYPLLGHLAAVDRPKAAQLWPGDEVRFSPITVQEAIALARAQEARLAAFAV
jgi:5-oxoprolinase (ATP-hydrolysing) subunit C